MSDMLSRLDNLERENRRLKRGGAVALVLLGSFILMGQSQTRKIVTAQKFELKDDQGKTAAVLAIVGGAPVLSLLCDDLPVTVLSGGDSPRIIVRSQSRGFNNQLTPMGLSISTPGGGSAALDIVDLVPSLTLRGTRIDEKGNVIGTKNTLTMRVSSSSSFLKVEDEDNFHIIVGSAGILGSTGLNKGMKHKTNALITLLNAENNVMWSAP
jgi:hypothetical protein